MNTTQTIEKQRVIHATPINRWKLRECSYLLHDFLQHSHGDWDQQIKHEVGQEKAHSVLGPEKRCSATSPHDCSQVVMNCVHPEALRRTCGLSITTHLPWEHQPLSRVDHPRIATNNTLVVLIEALPLLARSVEAGGERP